jgi:hypothetical protein
MALRRLRGRERRGDTCTACGATVTETVVQTPPAEATPAPEGNQHRRSGSATRPRPRSRCGSSRAAGSSSIGPDDGPYDVYDFFDLAPAADTDTTVDGYERIDTRPRVRVYGCCLPIALGMLLALMATITLLGNLLLGAL